MPKSGPDPQDPRLIAGIELLRRTGMLQFQLRYSDDETPVVWMAVGKWVIDGKGMPTDKKGRIVYEACAATDPIAATLRLCDEMMDGGTCAHCGKPAGVTEHWQHSMPLADVICWWQYDPETKQFRRGCEGD